MNRRALWIGAGGLALAVAWLAGCSVGDFEMKDGQARSRDVNLSVGNVGIGRDCYIEGKITLQAGNVEVGDRSQITGEIRVKHGNVELGDGVQAQSVTVSNGTIELGRQAVVAGPVRLTNGVIDVRGASIEGTVELVRGRLDVRGGARLADGLRVANVGHALRDSTFVVIEAGARVSGTVDVSGYARLLVDPAADVADADFVGLEPEYRMED